MTSRPLSRQLAQWTALSLAIGWTAAALAQSPRRTPPAAPNPAGAAAPELTKIDPPNWWANLPAAMLLVRGDHLSGARFHLAGPGVRIDHTTISANGHWAQLWLTASPTHPLTTTITAETSAGHASLPFRFEPRRSAADGFAGFSSRDVMYLIMPDRFADGDLTNDGPEAHDAASSPAAAAERAKPKGWHGGDLRGIIDHLDYLQQLGITTLWITPVYQNHSAVAYHGYHATDYYAVDEHFGSLADLQQLSKALHTRGMKLVLDTVPNHVGPYHPWVTDEPAPDWFHGTAADHPGAEYNFYALINPHAPERDRIGTLHGWFQDVPPLPDNDTDSPAVSQYLRQNVIWWIEQTGADGLRYDTFPYVNREFWHDLNFSLRTLYPQLTEVGEVSDGDPLVTSSFADGVTRAGVDTGLWTPFDFPFHYALRNVFATGAPMTELAKTLREDSLYAHPERLVPFLDNHDQTRFMSEPGATATAERLAMATLLTTRGLPQLYSGDELALAGGEDPDNRRDFPGGFSSGSGKAQANAFDAATRTAQEQAMFTWTQQLLALRKSQPALQTGTEQVLLADKDTFVFTRDLGGEHVLVAVHRGGAVAHLPIKSHLTSLDGSGFGRILFGSGTASLGAPGSGSPGEGNLDLNLPSDSITVALFHGAAVQQR